MEWIYQFPIGKCLSQIVTKSMKNRENWNFLWGSKNFNFLQLTYFSYKGHENEQFGKVSSKYMHF